MNLRPRLGMVVGGSLSRGLEVRLDAGMSPEELAVGQHVVIWGQQRRFFGMITDVSLEAADPRLPSNPPDVSDPFIAAVLAGTATYAQLKVIPLLALALEGPAPVKTVPPHFSAVHLASEADIALVFGQEDERHLAIGTPLDMETKVCLDIPEFVMRSNGIFGKSGTGKSFLTRTLLTLMIQAWRATRAVALIFDMHNEYAFEVRSEAGKAVKGLKQLFPAQVAVFTLDPESTLRRGLAADFEVRIGYDEIEPEDIALLRELLNIHERGLDAVHEMAELYGQDEWLATFFSKSTRQVYDDLKERTEVALPTLRALRLSLNRLRRFDFLVPQTSQSSVNAILDCVNRPGAPLHVVLEFGRYRHDPVAYVLVANLLTRRLHDRYVQFTERAHADPAAAPNPLVVVVEEAHYFLSPQIAVQTTFGTIAREMRKYNVTLLVIDQRPSGIDEEVMSQLGTKMCLLLDNERDVDAVLAGVSGRSELRSVLSRLESRQQALIFGHALPVPVAVRVRDPSDPDFYRALSPSDAERRRRADQDYRELFGD